MHNLKFTYLKGMIYYVNIYINIRVWNDAISDNLVM